MEQAVMDRDRVDDVHGAAPRINGKQGFLPQVRGRGVDRGAVGGPAETRRRTIPGFGQHSFVTICPRTKHDTKSVRFITGPRHRQVGEALAGPGSGFDQGDPVLVEGLADGKGHAQLLGPVFVAGQRLAEVAGADDDHVMAHARTLAMTWSVIDVGDPRSQASTPG